MQDYAEPVGCAGFSHYLAFSMGDWQVHSAYAPGEYAGAGLIDLQVDPTALKSAGVIAG